MIDERTPDILKKIVATKRDEVAELAPLLADFRGKAEAAPPPLDFKSALSGPGLSVIAEVKKASPSAGTIAEDFDPVDMAAAYLRGGADAVSVLTDRQYFQGDPTYVAAIRPGYDLPILRKDFIIDPVQIHQARALGADSFLLIAAILETNELRQFIELGRLLGMEPLVEVHDELELEKAVAAGTAILGVNNRDLHTFKVDLGTSERLGGEIPPKMIKVSESGIFNGEDARRLVRAGFDAILVGQSLMEAGVANCAAKIAEFKRE